MRTSDMLLLRDKLTEFKFAAWNLLKKCLFIGYFVVTMVRRSRCRGLVLRVGASPGGGGGGGGPLYMCYTYRYVLYSCTVVKSGVLTVMANLTQTQKNLFKVNF